MKWIKIKFIIFFMLVLAIQSKAQNCDTAIVISGVETHQFQSPVFIGVEIDSLSNGLITSRNIQGVNSERYYYDSLNRLINSVKNTDSILYTYDQASQIIYTEYFYRNTAIYRPDTSAVEYHYGAHGIDSIVKFRWNGTSLIPFSQKLFIYNFNDTLIRILSETVDSVHWIVDTLSVVTYVSGMPGISRIDSLYSDSIAQVFPERINYYDSLGRLKRIEYDPYGGAFGYEDFSYTCGRLSDYDNSCLGCHSGFYESFQFDSICRLIYSTNGAYDLTGGNTETQYTYYYTGCSTIATIKSFDESICLGDSVSIGVQIFGGVAPYHIQWLPSDGLASDTLSFTMASPDTSTRYIVNVIDANGNSAYDRINIQVAQRPFANIHVLSIDTTSVCQSAVLVSDSINDFTYYWRKPYSFQILSFNSHLLISDNSTYIVVVGNGSGNSGVCPEQTDSFTFNQFTNPAPVVSYIPGCNEIIIPYNEPVTVQWYKEDILFPSSGNDTLITNQYGNYSAIATDSNGCISSGNSNIYYSQALSDSVCDTLHVSADQFNPGENYITVSPNPFTDHFTAQLNNIGNIQEVIVLNILGERQSILNNFTKGNSINIEMDNLQKGIYILQIKTSSGSYSEQLIKY